MVCRRDRKIERPTLAWSGQQAVQAVSSSLIFTLGGRQTRIWVPLAVWPWPSYLTSMTPVSAPDSWGTDTSSSGFLLLLLLLSHFSYVRLCNPMDFSPPGSPVPGILQARTLEWVAISFSNAGKWKVKMKSLNCVRLCATPWTAANQAPPSMGFSRQEYWSGLPLPSPSGLLRGFNEMDGVRKVQSTVLWT